LSEEEQVNAILRNWLNNEEERESIDSPGEIQEYCLAMCGFDISYQIAIKVWNEIATIDQKVRYQQNVIKAETSEPWYDSDEFRIGDSN
jgi:hypothetical protein